MALERNPITRSTPFLAEFFKLPLVVHYLWINSHGGFISYDKDGVPRKKLIPLNNKEDEKERERNIKESKMSFRVTNAQSEVKLNEAVENSDEKDEEDEKSEDDEKYEDKIEDTEVVEMAIRGREDVKIIKEIPQNAINETDNECNISQEESNFDVNDEINDEESNSISPPGKSTYSFHDMKPVHGGFSIIKSDATKTTP